MSWNGWGNNSSASRKTTDTVSENLHEGRASNVINYSGVFETGANYQQFDITYSTGNRRFYYAKENITYGGGVSISDDKRFALLPHEAGPNAHYIIDTFNRPDDVNAALQVGHVIDVSGTTGDNDGRYKILNIEKNYTSTTVDNLTGAAIKIWGTSPSSYIENFENTGSHVISLSTINATPESNPDLWSSDHFFFDADYGSSVNFRANNVRHEYGNGYYILQPRGINSLTFEANLKFNNRTNREANAVIHFVESHLGQLEVDSSSPNLKYKQGISGFRWDGNAMFNPYRSVENESKTFYCTDFNHSLNFENSNDVNLVLRNLDTSILRKSEQLYIRKADTYDDTVFYEKNDVAFYTGNHEHYYWHSDASSSNKDPAEIKNDFNERENYSQDLNTGYWTRDFFWKPSLSLNISNKPRMNEITVGGGYTQIYSDGINENLLNLDLQFNNRSDEEAYAILHFLEQKLGCKPFNFTPPAPYNRKKNFVCQEWTHAYNYKNNHSISAKFEEFPFNIDSEGYTNLNTDPQLEEGELVFSSPVSFSMDGEGERIIPGEKGKTRVKFKNIGDTPVQLYNAEAIERTIGTFDILGQSNSNVPFVPYDLNKEDYIYTLPNVNFPFNLAGKTIKLSKSYTPGISDGGQMFTVVTGSAGNYKPEQVNGVSNSFFQNNRGQIKSGINENINTLYQDSDYYVVEDFFRQNTKSTIEGGEEGYIDIEFGDISQTSVYVNLRSNSDSIIDANGNNIVVDLTNRYFYADLRVQSSTRYSPQVGELKVFISATK
jgi:phage-related protein